MSKKLSKEDLEQDLLIEYSSRFVYFYNQNKATVLGGGIAIVLVIALIIGYFVYSAQQEQQAQILLGAAEQSLMNGNFERALYGDDDALTLGFIQIARNYGRTDAGNLAHYYAALAEYELGNFEESLSHILNYRAPRGILGVAPVSMNGIILLELDRFEEAAAIFERAADWDRNSATTPYNLFEAAQAHIEAGNRQRAIELLNTILSDFPNSQQSTRAQRLIGMLTATS